MSRRNTDAWSPENETLACCSTVWQALELLAARENELLSQEDKERRDEEETGGDVTKAEEALLIAENLHHTLSTVGNKAEPIGVVRGGGVGVSTASGGEDGAGESGHDRQLMEAAMEVVKQASFCGRWPGQGHRTGRAFVVKICNVCTDSSTHGAL